MGWFTRKPKQQERLLDQLDAVLHSDSGMSRHCDEQPVEETGVAVVTADDVITKDLAVVDDIALDFGVFSIELPDGAQVLPALLGTICESVFVTVENWQINIGVIAAPRSGSYWQTYSQKLVDDNPGEFEVITTPSGPELIATDPETALPLRVTGIDGNGWVLKVTYLGRIAHDTQMRQRAKAIIDTIRVTRPEGVYLPGEVLPLDVSPLLEFVPPELMSQELMDNVN